MPSNELKPISTNPDNTYKSVVMVVGDVVVVDVSIVLVGVDIDVVVNTSCLSVSHDRVRPHD